MYNAYLQYRLANGRSTYRMWVMDIQQTHNLAGMSAQSKMFQHFYPKSYSPGAIDVTGRVRTQEDYDSLADYIRKHQLLLVSGGGFSNTGPSEGQIPLIRMGIPSEALIVEGWIDSFQAGARRFNPAPEFKFSFYVVKDAHSANSDMIPAYAMRKWWSGEDIGLNPIQNRADTDYEDQYERDWPGDR